MKPANLRDAWTIAALAACGIVLGVVMTPLFAPVPKIPAAEPAQLSGRAAISASGEPRIWIEPGPEDATVAYSGTYVPSDAYDGAIWQYPAPAYEPWEPEPTFAQEDTGAPEAGGAWAAADEAEAAAKEAAAAAQQSETVRKTDLAEGLY
ncbi:hypothetical protein [Altererythrobacter sp. Root672]|uniref:hypothetical protein n=1 Tax=Altererythrobacter sp. Root672 TaxID=1736584 RepID=UPI000B2F6F48|nr:hypothetical protein [Altererythrobacter sp. Root672]